MQHLVWLDTLKLLHSSSFRAIQLPRFTNVLFLSIIIFLLYYNSIGVRRWPSVLLSNEKKVIRAWITLFMSA